MTSIPPRPRTAAGRDLIELWIAESEVPGHLDWFRFREMVAAIEAEAAAGPPASAERALDVERLAKALSETWGGTPPNWSSDGRLAPERAKRAFAAEAEPLAAAYARLAAEEPHD